MTDTQGVSYDGRRRITESGRVCQRWLDQTPHRHNMTDASLFPDADLSSAENYCRNPDGSSSGPWCYTLDSDVERESCAVPLCRGKSLTKLCISTALLLSNFNRSC